MTLHALRDCPACVLHVEDVEPYSDPDDGDVECSRCFDERKICITCDEEWIGNE
jgi:hypothetical protein